MVRMRVNNGLRARIGGWTRFIYRIKRSRVRVRWVLSGVWRGIDGKMGVYKGGEGRRRVGGGR